MRRELFNFIFLASLGWAGAAELREVAELMEARCLDCHDGETREGGVDLEQLLAAKDVSAKANRKVWLQVDRVVATGEMPPKKAKNQPSAKELAAFEKLLAKQYFSIQSKLPKEAREKLCRKEVRRKAAQVRGPR